MKAGKFEEILRKTESQHNVKTKKQVGLGIFQLFSNCVLRLIGQAKQQQILELGELTMFSAGEDLGKVATLKSCWKYASQVRVYTVTYC